MREKKAVEEMKEAYTEPKLELIAFEIEDVITSSEGLYVPEEDELPFIPANPNR